MSLEEHITQGQLDYLFMQLGYQLREVENGPRIWENTEFDAVMLLPVIAPEKPARLHHLMTLRKIAIQKGIVEPEKFDALLEQACQYAPNTIASKGAA